MIYGHIGPLVQRHGIIENLASGFPDKISGLIGVQTLDGIYEYHNLKKKVDDKEIKKNSLINTHLPTVGASSAVIIDHDIVFVKHLLQI